MYDTRSIAVCLSAVDNIELLHNKNPEDTIMLIMLCTFLRTTADPKHGGRGFL